MADGGHCSPLRLTDLTAFDVAYEPLRLTNEFKPRPGWQTLNTTIAVPHLSIHSRVYITHDRAIATFAVGQFQWKPLSTDPQ